MKLPLIVLLGAGLTATAVHGAERPPAFVADGKAFRFDTGALRGTLRAEGRSLGLTGVVDAGTGKTVSRFNGLLSHYRLLDSDTRYGDGAWDWASTAQLLTNGAVAVEWPADAAHPFSMRAVYEWATSNALDVTTTVVAAKPLRGFEVFLASYFEGFPEVYGCGSNGIVSVTKPMGAWLAFPRDAAAAALIEDGRWQRPPHPVTFKPLQPYGGALGVRRDPQTGLVGLIMAPPQDGFAVLMPYGEEAHRSLYLSLFGRDFTAGERATARARLVVVRGLTDVQAIETYTAYLKDIQP